MNKVTVKLIKVAAVSGLVLPIVLGGLLAVFGLSPEFAFNPGGGLFSLLASGSGWMVYLLVALMFFVATLIPTIVSNVAINKGSVNRHSMNRVPAADGSTAATDAADQREDGEVKWFNPNKGYGFITRSNGEEIFAHFRSIRGRGHRTLRQGQKVKFKAVEGEKGLQAEDISPL